MFLFEPTHTAFDLHFRIFRIPVRVHPMFWLFSAVLGWGYLPHGIEYVLLWIACMFVSILVHELGHVFMALAFGNPSHVVLYAFGGLAIRNRVEPYRWQRIAVSLAGPVAGFLLCGLVWVTARHGLARWDPFRDRPMLWAGLGMLIFMNLFWNLLNLLPIWPLDGGKISQELLSGLSPRNGLRLSLGISFLVAGLLAINAILVERGQPLLPIPYLDVLGGTYMALFFAMLALESFMLLQQTQAGHGETPWRRYDPWD